MWNIFSKLLETELKKLYNEFVQSSSLRGSIQYDSIQAVGPMPAAIRLPKRSALWVHFQTKGGLL
jgi:hypothetical protein